MNYKHDVIEGFITQDLPKAISNELKKDALSGHTHTTKELELVKCSKNNNISLDSFIISTTPYDELFKRYDDGTWTKEKFAEKHILFQENQADCRYIDPELHKY